MASHVSVHEKGFTVLIVCLHGFTGHPKNTWTLKRATKKSKKRAATPSIPQSDTAASEGQQREGVYWPADLACRTIPGSRILTYGYDTRLRHWFKGPVSKKTVYDHAWDLLCSLEALRRNPNERSRPVLFVAHSLGGIVVKEAMRRSQGCASTKAHLHSIFEAVVGVLFFGTPHRGADPRNFFHYLLSASARAFGVQVNSQIVDTLMPDAERLTELRDEFPTMCHTRKWQIFSFQEEYGDVMLFGSKVVDDQSSCLDDPTIETKQHISRNHMDMCRFSGLQDSEYSKVAAAMTFIFGTIENGADTIDPIEIRAEEYRAAGNTSQQPPGVPPSTPHVLRRQPPPGAVVVALDSRITDPLGIEVSMLPSQGVLLFMDRLPREAHADIADVIFSNCKVACFNFYQLHGLHRTKFGRRDNAFARKLFQVSDSPGPDCFPQTANDFSLEQWTSKLVHAHGRINAAEEGHEAIVKLLVATGKVDVDARDNSGQTALWWAAQEGHEAVVKLLLAIGKVDVNARDNKHGRTPLWQAAQNGDKAIVKLLLGTGKVDVDARDKYYSRTPLLWAAEKGHEAIFKLLLGTGKVDIDARDKYYSSTSPVSCRTEFVLGSVVISTGRVSHALQLDLSGEHLLGRLLAVSRPERVFPAHYR